MAYHAYLDYMQLLKNWKKINPLHRNLQNLWFFNKMGICEICVGLKSSHWPQTS